MKGMGSHVSDIFASNLVSLLYYSQNVHRRNKVAFLFITLILRSPSVLGYFDFVTSITLQFVLANGYKDSKNNVNNRMFPMFLYFNN